MATHHTFLDGWSFDGVHGPHLTHMCPAFGYEQTCAFMSDLLLRGCRRQNPSLILGGPAPQAPFLGGCRTRRPRRLRTRPPQTHVNQADIPPKNQRCVPEGLRPRNPPALIHWRAPPKEKQRGRGGDSCHQELSIDPKSHPQSDKVWTYAVERPDPLLEVVHASPPQHQHR